MSNDPNLWLEDVTGERAMEWVAARSAEAEADLETEPSFAGIHADVLAALQADDRLAVVAQAGDFLYSFWTDAEHPRGLWRRTTWDSYRSDAVEWDILLDLDALGAAEGESWVWHGARLLRPDYRKVLITLSPGGSDADVTREFDLETREFAADGFVRPESKGGITWLDADTTLVFTDGGAGSMTTSGYPRTVREWKRGTDLSAAPIVFEGETEDLLVQASHDLTPGFERTTFWRAKDFYTHQQYVLIEGEQRLIDIPDSAESSLHREWLTILLRHDWEIGDTTHPSGSVLVIDFDQFMAGSRDFRAVFVPDAHSSLDGWAWTKNYLVLTVLHDVRHQVRTINPSTGVWEAQDLELGVEDLATVTLGPVDSRESDVVWVYATSFITPLTVGLLDLADPRATTEMLKQGPSRFDSTGLAVTQHWATSADGTRIPYFQIGSADLDLDGSNPTVMHGYGGFEIPLTPAYDAITGLAWLSRGGVYVVANIRGGGEFGPAWHQSALREKRVRAYDDFAAVARDLVSRGVTSVEHLGCVGRSNGGLLVGNMLAGYPDDFGAIVCQVPLLDMQRYTKLLAGASWVAEYGDPDVAEDWEFLEGYSAYHRFNPKDNTPPTYLATSTKDDRVHPGHARKMAELLRTAGKEVTYWEQTEGGHGGASTAEQTAQWHTLPWAFLHRHLGIND